MSEKFTRREFLQSACISVGALATTAGATNVFAGELPKGNENGLPSVDVLIIGSGGAGLRAATARSQAISKLNRRCRYKDDAIT